MDNLSGIERAERIDRYLNGELSAEETQAFETALNRDRQLQQEYEDVRMIRTLAQEHGLRDQIKSIRQSMRQEETGERMIDPVIAAPNRKAVTTPDSEPGKVRSLWRAPAYAGRIAAGVAILLVGFLALQFATLSSDDLYAEKAIFYQVAASRSAGTPDITPEAQLMEQYRSQRFAEVTTTYEQLREPSLMALFLAGNAYLQEEQTDRAIQAFHRIVEINGSQGINRFEEDAQYYLALSYLKADRPADALPLLEAINADPQHSYHSSVSDYYLWKVKLLNRLS